MMTIGFQLHGKTREFSNQYLATEFFTVGIPVWPVSSYFVNQETGLKLLIPLSRESLYSFYLGGGLIWLGAILFGSSFMIASFLTELFIYVPFAALFFS